MKKLKLNRRPLNMKDPRIRKKLLGALELAYEIQLEPQGCRSIAAKEFYALVGPPNRAVGVYLRRVFVLARQYSVGQFNKSYGVDVAALRELEAQLEVPNGLLEVARRLGRVFDEPAPRLHTLPRTRNRYYPWWVTMKKTHRHELFIRQHGHLWDYDIAASKATLMYQLYESKMRDSGLLWSLPANQLPTWRRMISDRTTFRKELAEEANITVADAKWITQIILSGGFASPGNETWRRFGKGIQRIIDSRLYQDLRRDFKIFWRNLRILVPVDGTAGETVSKLYEDLEIKVMHVIEESLVELGISAWFVHDGLMTIKKLDVTSLQEIVNSKLNLSIYLEETLLREYL